MSVSPAWRRPTARRRRHRPTAAGRGSSCERSGFRARRGPCNKRGRRARRYASPWCRATPSCRVDSGMRWMRGPMPRMSKPRICGPKKRSVRRTAIAARSRGRLELWMIAALAVSREDEAAAETPIFRRVSLGPDIADVAAEAREILVEPIRWPRRRPYAVGSVRTGRVADRRGQPVADRVAEIAARLQRIALQLAGARVGDRRSPCPVRPCPGPANSGCRSTRTR